MNICKIKYGNFASFHDFLRATEVVPSIVGSPHVDDDVEKIARYINGLRSRIQDEISFVKLESVEEAYQYALKAEKILKNKYEQR